MNIVEKRLDQIQPYENNPRKNDNAVPYVAESIKRYGFKVPIIIDKDGVIVAGHTRYLASIELGLETVPCIVADDLTDEEIKEFRLVDNKVAEFAGWDFNLLDAELQELDFDGFDFGFDADIYDEDYGTDFELPDGEKADICQITFYLHEEQAELIRYAMSIVENEVHETFGNKNKHGNELYEVVRQWAEQRK